MIESAGHDVVWLRTAAPGASDPEALAWAARDARILLTFDKDERRGFGSLAKKEPAFFLSYWSPF
jgi:hypothetical protein